MWWPRCKWGQRSACTIRGKYIPSQNGHLRKHKAIDWRLLLLKHIGVLTCEVVRSRVAELFRSICPFCTARLTGDRYGQSEGCMPGEIWSRKASSGYQTALLLFVFNLRESASHGVSRPSIIFHQSSSLCLPHSLCFSIILTAWRPLHSSIQLDPSFNVIFLHQLPSKSVHCSFSALCQPCLMDGQKDR